MHRDLYMRTDMCTHLYIYIRICMHVFAVNAYNCVSEEQNSDTGLYMNMYIHPYPRSTCYIDM